MSGEEMTASCQPKSLDLSHRDARRSRLIDFATNVAVLGVLWIGYQTARGATADDLTSAFHNAGRVLSFQSRIGLPSELDLQRSLLDRTSLLRAANIYYLFIHFPATISLLAWTWLRHRSSFGRIRNTLVVVTAAGMVIHATFPLAPPRMLEGFVDTGATIGPSPYNLAIAEAANQIAAMPSLHAAWALIVALSFASIFDGPWRWVGLAHPILTTIVVVITANHYWADVIVAVGLVLLGWALTHLSPSTPSSFSVSSPKTQGGYEPGT